MSTQQVDRCPVVTAVRLVHPSTVCAKTRGEGVASADDNCLTFSKAVPTDLADGLRATPKYVPSRFLYDETGSRIYELITQLPTYYPFEAERSLLEANARDIIAHISAGSVVAELGVGDGAKTSLLLRALLERDGVEGVRFCGIDCSAEALNQCRTNLQRDVPKLGASSLELIEAEYLEGVAAVRRRHPDATMCLLWLGSSVGNFSNDAAAGFLRQLANAAGGRMQLLLCTDLWKDQGILRSAYNESQGVSEAFVKNGMRHALRVLGQPESAADPANWEYDCYVNPKLQQVEMWLVAKKAVSRLLGERVGILAGERVRMAISRKFTVHSIADMAHKAGLCIQATWGDARYQITMLATELDQHCVQN